MRIAILVIGICLTVIMSVQSCAALTIGAIGAGLGEAIGDSANASELSAVSSAGAAGIVAALFAFMGAGFVMKFPRVSIFLFSIASLIAFTSAASSAYGDLYVWGGCFGFLTVLSYFAQRRDRWIPFKQNLSNYDQTHSQEAELP